MIIIQPGFGLSITQCHMFGKKESNRKMLSIKLPFIQIYWLNREATSYWYECARFAFNDPDWFVKNHHAVRQAKRMATVTRMKAYQKAYDENNREFRGQLDKLQDDNCQLRTRLQEASRDIQAYKRLVNGESNANPS
ncbi:hypothetical protein [Flyfo siphovirus Tbat2_3]|nr:hypothetical protein [Flyfo siphovirus Tbat2_3]